MNDEAEELRTETERLRETTRDSRLLLVAASFALRSYQHGNSSPALAEEVADTIDAALADLRHSAKEDA